MPNRKAICVSLTPELWRFVADQVASGRYQTASEVFRAGLRLLQHDDPPPHLPQGSMVPSRRRPEAEPERP